MQISEVARRTGVTTKALRYYEGLGLLEPRRLSNGYRDYDEGHLRLVAEIRDLAATGIAIRDAMPFVDCIAQGHEHGDDCVSSLVAYRDNIAEIDRAIGVLQERRARLIDRLEKSASRTFTKEKTMTDHTRLPDNLPVPTDDGAAAHLPGVVLPELSLPTSDGRRVQLSQLDVGRTVIYLYPLTGRPDADLPDGWDSIPGARGCTSEACDFRDHYDDLHAEGVTAVWGLSSQDTAYQAEVVDRLRLPFAMISDENFELERALGLPTFSADGQPRLYRRLTLVVRDGSIEHVFYPIFPPNTHAQQVLDWLRANPAK
ncbi:redoxin family protein [Microbacterium sp. NPDC089189]|uniref:redoxin family protein n=1 Tax=Microbacterium sp. NPDC089189 TaxID=3154972 RepID=UPI003433DEB9